MTNSIAERITDFLKDYEPFKFLGYTQLLEISKNINVLNIEKNKFLFQINDTLNESFYVVFNGSINLSVISDAEETLLNICRAGDIFGLRPFFAKNNYMMSAKAREESIIYAIPIAIFKPLLTENTRVLDFLLESFASTSSFSKENAIGKINDTIRYNDNQTEVQYFQTLEYAKRTLKVNQENTIQEVAMAMSDNMVNYALVVENGLPIGIVTDSDFRSKIATGRYPVLSPIDKIMNTPVVTVNQNLSLAEAQLLMVKNNTTHLCVTEDGSKNSTIKGIITENDLVVAQANNPGILIKEIKRAMNVQELTYVREKLSELIYISMNNNIPPYNISMISGEIIFSITKRTIDLAILELGSAPARFAWLNMGSQGRKEQLLLGDQDNILIFEDVKPERYRDVKDYFFKLSKVVTSNLEKIGFALCSNGHNSTNPNCCKSLSDWTKHYSSWINTPGENTADISGVFFDYEYVYGEILLEEALTETIFSNCKPNSLIFDFLGNDALKKPAPVNFFKKFNLEEDGENKGKFDIKTRALMPLIDIARILTLSHGIRGINNTYLRYKQLAIVDNKNEEIYKESAEVFLLLSKFRTLEGQKNDSSGQYLNMDEMSKSDKEKLKNSFLVLKDLEDIIKDKFQLTHFS